MNYKLDYKGKVCFLSWCKYWVSQNMQIRHSGWKHIYPSIVKVEVSTPELVKKYGPKWKIYDPYFVVYEDNSKGFIDHKAEEKRMGTGNWEAIPKTDIDDIFE